jgi:hypothetical protein
MTAHWITKVDEMTASNKQQCDVVTLGRNVVWVIRASGTLRDAFDNVIKHRNTKMLFKLDGKVIQVKELQLLQSVHTRWDSVYYMLNHLCDIRQVYHLSFF